MTYAVEEKVARFKPFAPHFLTPEHIGQAQIAVYVMVGGGMVGRMAAEQPADFYIDARVSRRPWPLKDIYLAVATLAEMAREAGLDPHRMPAMPNLHNLGVF